MSKNKFAVLKKLNSNLKFNPIKLNRDNLKPVFTFCDFIKDTDFYTEEDGNSDKCALYNFLNSSQDFCSQTWRQIKSHPMFHYHEIEENKNIPVPPGFGKEIPFIQFKLPKHKEGRFIGFFDEKDVFHIILYDRKHQIYKRK